MRRNAYLSSPLQAIATGEIPCWYLSHTKNLQGIVTSKLTSKFIYFIAILRAKTADQILPRLSSPVSLTLDPVVDRVWGGRGESGTRQLVRAKFWETDT